MGTLDLVYARQLSSIGTRGLGPVECATLLDLVSAGRVEIGGCRIEANS